MLIPGEGQVNEIVVRAGIREVEGAVILDPDGLVVTMAECVVDLRAHGTTGNATVGDSNDAVATATRRSISRPVQTD